MQSYSNPKRENDPHALPDVEIFAGTQWSCHECDNVDTYSIQGKPNGTPLCQVCGGCMDGTGGWFWFFCFPGCLPDSEAYGPFKTEASALVDAQEQGLEELEMDG